MTVLLLYNLHFKFLGQNSVCWTRF